MFSKRLKELRSAKGITQEELGQIIFVSRSAIAKWEQGKGMPSKQSLNLLSEYFNIPADALLKEDDPVLIINNIERDFKKSKLLLTLCFSITIVILLILLMVILFGNNVYKKKDGFYDQKILVEHGLNKLKPINGVNGYHMINGTYRCTIDSAETMHEYAIYLYEFLSNSLNLSYLSISHQENIYEDDLGYIYNNYLIKTNSYKDHFDQTYSSGEYTFYFISNYDANRNIKDKVFPTRITITMPCYGFSEEYLEEKEIDYNFRMDISTTKDNEKISYFLAHEYYEIDQIQLNNDNWKQYYRVNENVKVDGIYISVQEINPKCLLYYNVYLEATIENNKTKERQVYKIQYDNIIAERWKLIVAKPRELGNYNCVDIYVSNYEVEYEILEGSKVWLLIKK